MVVLEKYETQNISNYIFFSNLQGMNYSIAVSFLYPSYNKIDRMQRNLQKILRDYLTDFLRIPSQIPREKISVIILMISPRNSFGILSGTPTPEFFF